MPRGGRHDRSSPGCRPARRGGRQRVAAEQQPLLQLVTDRLEVNVAERAQCVRNAAVAAVGEGPAVSDLIRSTNDQRDRPRVEETPDAVRSVSDAHLDAVVDEMLAARGIACYAGGREGLVMRGLVMRLFTLAWTPLRRRDDLPGRRPRRSLGALVRTWADLHGRGTRRCEQTRRRTDALLHRTAGEPCAAPKLIAWPVTCGSFDPSGGP
jgi:hypothetical protein